jgi:hypothetical protein
LGRGANGARHQDQGHEHDCLSRVAIDFSTRQHFKPPQGGILPRLAYFRSGF